MKLAISAVALLAASSAMAQQSNNVKGHFRSDGTYVQPHYRTNPDNSKLNNYSTAPNYNPYTGKAGTVDPYAPPSYGNTKPKKGYGNPY